MRIIDKLLTPKEVAAKLYISRSLVSVMLRDGRLKGILISERNWRVKSSDLSKFIEKKCNLDEKKTSILKDKVELVFWFVSMIIGILVGIWIRLEVCYEIRHKRNHSERERTNYLPGWVWFQVVEE